MVWRRHWYNKLDISVWVWNCIRQAGTLPEFSSNLLYLWLRNSQQFIKKVQPLCWQSICRTKFNETSSVWHQLGNNCGEPHLRFTRRKSQRDRHIAPDQSSSWFTAHPTTIVNRTLDNRVVIEPRTVRKHLKGSFLRARVAHVCCLFYHWKLSHQKLCIFSVTLEKYGKL